MTASTVFVVPGYTAIAAMPGYAVLVWTADLGAPGGGTLESWRVILWRTDDEGVPLLDALGHPAPMTASFMVDFKHSSMSEECVTGLVNPDGRVAHMDTIYPTIADFERAAPGLCEANGKYLRACAIAAAAAVSQNWLDS